MTNEETLEIYRIAKTRAQRVNSILKDFNDNKEIAFAESFLKELDIPLNKDNLYSAIQRLVILKEDGIINIFKSNDLTDSEIEEKLIKAYALTINYQVEEDKIILKQLQTSNSISTDIKNILEVLYSVITAHNSMYIKWYSEVVLYNKTIMSEYNTEESALAFLNKNKLYDYLGDTKYDCSYSALKKDNEGNLGVITYGELFKRDLTNMTNKINNFISNIKSGDIHSLEYKKYFEVLLIAFNNLDISKNIKNWENVDSAWMDLNLPLQSVHLMEYYEDSLRNSVSIDFDVRIDDPSKNSNTTGSVVLNMMETYIDSNHKGKFDNLSKVVKNNINKVQLHIGELLFYSGGEMRGLMSAQVIPNNEEVSTKKGKKIFAFMEKGYEAELNRPKMKLRHEVFPPEYIKEEDSILLSKEKWEKIYDITTIGHEYGHVLWKEEDTELIMSKSNIFKNIEEFKASAGGVVAFFNSKDEEILWKEILMNTISRSIKLIAWKEVSEVEPYYCESLITLNILYKARIIYFENNKLTINYSYEDYLLFKEVYTNEYYALVEHYLEKKDAKKYLDIHSRKKDGYYLSNMKEVAKIQNYYFELYRNIGNELY
jgi:hypothetical protein